MLQRDLTAPRTAATIGRHSLSTCLLHTCVRETTMLLMIHLLVDLKSAVSYGAVFEKQMHDSAHYMHASMLASHQPAATHLFMHICKAYLQTRTWMHLGRLGFCATNALHLTTCTHARMPPSSSVNTQARLSINMHEFVQNCTYTQPSLTEK